MMGISTFQQNFPQGPIIDPKTGQLTKDGRYFVLAHFNRTGGAAGVPSINPSLTATGSTASDALLLTNDLNHVDTVPSGSGGIMPKMNVGADIIVSNGGANAMKVYPPSGARLDSAAVNAPYVLNPGALRHWQVFADGQLRTIGTNGVP